LGKRQDRCRASGHRTVKWPAGQGIPPVQAAVIASCDDDGATGRQRRRRYRDGRAGQERSRQRPGSHLPQPDPVAAARRDDCRPGPAPASARRPHRRRRAIGCGPGPAGYAVPVPGLAGTPPLRQRLPPKGPPGTKTWPLTRGPPVPGAVVLAHLEQHTLKTCVLVLLIADDIDRLGTGPLTCRVRDRPHLAAVEAPHMPGQPRQRPRPRCGGSRPCRHHGSH
jgi:hypothetical protein